MQTALELYYNTYHQYPLSEGHDYEPDSDHWANDCDGRERSIDQIDRQIIPEIVRAKFFPGVKDLVACPGHQGYSYGSNGVDYKLVSHSETYGSDSYTGLGVFIDPAADSGFDNCTVDGGNFEHFGLWTEGAKCWVESDPIPGR